MSVRFLLDTSVVSEPLQPDPDEKLLEELLRYEQEMTSGTSYDSPPSVYQLPASGLPANGTWLKGSPLLCRSGLMTDRRRGGMLPTAPGSLPPGKHHHRAALLRRQPDGDLF
jgi:hypothetical protein